MKEIEGLHRQISLPEPEIAETMKRPGPLSFDLDMTDRKGAQQMLRMSEERSRREWMIIFQAIGHPAVIMDP
jgi:hypothetical protein